MLDSYVTRIEAAADDAAELERIKADLASAPGLTDAQREELGERVEMYLADLEREAGVDAGP